MISADTNRYVTVIGTMNTVLSAVKSTSANASDDMKASLTAIKQKYTLIVSIVMYIHTYIRVLYFVYLLVHGHTESVTINYFVNCKISLIRLQLRWELWKATKMLSSMPWVPWVKLQREALKHSVTKPRTLFIL